ncbi:PilX N-terminal domain-containing pilus assembly protein [Pseudomonas sp. NPDC088444]|uniref:pilus assembly PilX family protein n=1 Tax=Pseudomonas sp. NPDC088444 TaxID=3364456 RepID=UPI00385047A7
MTRPARHAHGFAPRGQTGATLIVAIIMLLIITVLALSSMRGVSLESRITGNLKQQKTLVNAAEAALRMGELSISQAQCSTTPSYAPCIPIASVTANTNADTPQLFNTSNFAANINTVAASSYDVRVQWYVVDLKLLGGQTQNNCALMARDCGRHYYEITACAIASSDANVTCSNNTTLQRTILRTVYAISDS